MFTRVVELTSKSGKAREFSPRRIVRVRSVGHPLAYPECRLRFPSAPTMTGVRLALTHADFSLRKRNSITFPRSSGKPRSIFLWKLFGM
jgi:hypothetical protein